MSVSRLLPVLVSRRSFLPVPVSRTRLANIRNGGLIWTSQSIGATTLALPSIYLMSVENSLIQASRVGIFVGQSVGPTSFSSKAPNFGDV